MTTWNYIFQCRSSSGYLSSSSLSISTLASERSRSRSRSRSISRDRKLSKNSIYWFSSILNTPNLSACFSQYDVSSYSIKLTSSISVKSKWVCNRKFNLPPPAGGSGPPHPSNAEESLSQFIGNVASSQLNITDTVHNSSQLNIITHSQEFITDNHKPFTTE